MIYQFQRDGFVEPRREFVLGAIIGDSVGAKYEWRSIHVKDFDLYAPNFGYTDDSIMTLAVMDILFQKAYSDEHKPFDIFRKWGFRYPDAGYGGRFMDWLAAKDYRQNDSYGNGAAMRVSPVGWYGTSEEEVRQLSRLVTQPSHCHPEGLKGAEVTALSVFYARTGKSKAFLRSFAESQYTLYPSEEALNLSNRGHGLETCQVSVPQALSAFFLTDSFESCLRTIIAAGGDCDTTAAIACGIAEAFYGIPDKKLKTMAVDQFRDDPEAIALLEGTESHRVFHEI